MNFVADLFHNKETGGCTYSVKIDLMKAAMDDSMFREFGEMKQRVFKRLEDHLFNELKDKVVADDVLTTKVVNELRLMAVKKLKDE